MSDRSQNAWYHSSLSGVPEVNGVDPSERNPNPNDNDHDVDLKSVLALILVEFK